MIKKIVCFFLLLIIPAWAKGDFNLDRSKPIDILADTLVVDDVVMKGIFSGNVQVIQDKFRLNCQNLIVFYDRGNDKTSSGATMNGKIRRLLATGNVLLSADTDTAKAGKAEYDLVSKKITMQGNVLVSRKEGILSGEIVEIYPDTRKIRVLSAGKKRIHSLIRLDKVKD